MFMKVSLDLMFMFLGCSFDVFESLVFRTFSTQIYFGMFLDRFFSMVF